MSSPITEKEVCETCDKTLKPGEGKSQLTGSFSCVVCPDCYEEEDICARKCEDCSVKLYGDDEGDKCQDCLDQEEEQRCPCGLTLSDDDLALESGKCEGCTMKDKDEDCDCEGYAWCSHCVTKKGKLPDACQDCGADAVWIKAFDRYSVVDGLCENCHHE